MRLLPFMTQATETIQIPTTLVSGYKYVNLTKIWDQICVSPWELTTG